MPRRGWTNEGGGGWTGARPSRWIGGDMSELPFSKFYWSDHQGDPLLRGCSFAAQGLWTRMLCIAAESVRYGHVLLNGRQPSDAELARVVGGTAEEVAALVEELDRNGVFSRDRSGTIYCRRMIREAKKRAASAKGGKIGGRTTYGKHKGIFSSQASTQGGTQNPDTRHQRPETRDPESKKKFSLSRESCA